MRETLLDGKRGNAPPPLVAVLFIVVGILEVAWIVVLFRNQVPRSVAHHLRYLRFMWSGLDVAEVMALVTTGIYLARRSPRVIVPASVAGTILLCDAWFNVIATVGRPHVAAVGMALLAEIPLATLCFWQALKASRDLPR